MIDNLRFLSNRISIDSDSIFIDTQLASILLEVLNNLDNIMLLFRHFMLWRLSICCSVCWLGIV